MALSLTTPPLLEPVSLSELKLQCGFGPMEDTDALREQTLAEQLRAAIAGAREDCEGICARAFLTQTWTMTLDRFPCPDYGYQTAHGHDITLALPTFQALDSFTYLDTTGAEIDNMALGAWGYQIVSGGANRPARLRPPVLRGWPLTQCGVPDAIAVSWTSGFGPTRASLPWAVRQAVKIDAQWLFEGGKKARPEAVMALLTPYIVDVL